MSAQLNVDDFLDRLATVESSGDPSARNNSSGAFGLFQILDTPQDPNWASWAKEAGRDPQDRSAANQRAVAQFKVNQYFDEFHSWEAVAVAWYAGESSARAYMQNPNAPRFQRRQGDQNEYPSINNYVNQVIGATPSTDKDYGRGAGNTDPTAPQAGQTQPAPAGGPPQVAIPGDSDLMSAYGWASVLADIPDVKKVMDDAVAQHWGPEQIQAAIMQTDWFKQRNSNQIQWEVGKRLHPQDSFQKANDLARKLQDDATKMGMTLDNDKANNMAVEFLTSGMSDQEQQKALQAQFHFDPAHPQGTAAKTLGALRAQAQDMFVPISDQALGQWVTDISTGKQTADTFNQYLRDQAKSLYPQMSASIDAGVTMRQFADPYIQMASNELNIAPQSVDMTDPRFQRALMQTDPQTGKRTPMTLDQWQTTLRTDPVYNYDGTVGAQNQAAKLASGLQKAMGVPL